jgi:hypothetical protein
VARRLLPADALIGASALHQMLYKAQYDSGSRPNSSRPTGGGSGGLADHQPLLGLTSPVARRTILGNR